MEPDVLPVAFYPRGLSLLVCVLLCVFDRSLPRPLIQESTSRFTAVQNDFELYMYLSERILS